MLSSVALDRKAGFDYSVRIVWSQQGLLVITSDDLAAFDWQSGKARWHAKQPYSDNLFAPAVVGENVTPAPRAAAAAFRPAARIRSA